eukprot:gb/GECH01012913.1/.p1 GENE.gb/GECH01012913.1/~~gb/GECH01012913.1/.p1  ORF type:complete len:190 (+),score=31.97 gb/GECH01012913.1/:1-570(+)
MSTKKEFWKQIKRNRYVIFYSILFSTIILSISFIIGFTIPEILTQKTHTQALDCQIIDGEVERLPLHKIAWAPRFELRYVNQEGNEVFSKHGEYRAEWQGSQRQAGELLTEVLEKDKNYCFYKRNSNTDDPVYLKVAFSAEAIIGIIATIVAFMTLMMGIAVYISEHSYPKQNPNPSTKSAQQRQYSIN